MAIPLEEPSAVDLGQPAEPLHLQLLQRLVELREVLFDAGVRQLEERFRAQLLDDRTQLAQGLALEHVFEHAGPMRYRL